LSSNRVNSLLRFDRKDQFLLNIVFIDKLPLTNMLFLLSSDPDLVFECASLLALYVLERACGIQARVEFAKNRIVDKLAVRYRAVRAVAAWWCVGMLEGAPRIRAVGIKFAIHLCLVGCPLGG